MLRILLAAGFAFAGSTAWADEKKTEKTFNTPTEAINHYIQDGYAKAKIAKPAGKASDLEFLRRAFIDILGRGATVEEVLDFEQDSAPNKRARLVSRLLNGVTNKGSDSRVYAPKVNGNPIKLEKDATELFDYPEQYGTHWANIWGVWLMTRSGNQTYREQMEAWLEDEFRNNTNHKDMTVKLLTAKGKTHQNGAVNFIIHHLGEATPNDKRMEVGPFDAIPVTSRVTRLFLGIQTNCTQCHDHPFNKEWVQSDFWGVNAYFRQTLRDATPTGGMDRRVLDAAKIELYDDTKFNSPQIIFYERRDGKLMASKPNFLKDLAAAEAESQSLKPLPKTQERSRREVLAEYVTNHDNFARAYVNRMWGHFFGRGLNKEPTIDDFGSHNEIVHPELLDYLAKEFVKYNYDQKKLIEWICTSDVYSLSHVANAAYVDPKYDPYFARMPLKALSPEVLYESLETAMRVKFNEQGGNRDMRRNFNQRSFIQKLVANFGDDEGNEMTFNGTVVQALMMMNGNELNGELGKRTMENPVNRIIAKHSKGGGINSTAVIDELYMAVLNRHPRAEELTKIKAVMDKGATIAAEKPADKPKDAPKVEPPKNPKKGDRPNRPMPNQQPYTGPRGVPASGPNDPTFYQDLFWALLNMNEFILNH